MKTLLINGSPKGTRGNSELFIQNIRKGMSAAVEVRYVAKENPHALADEMHGYDRILMVMPLYFFSMPGIVQELLEVMDENFQGVEFGYIVQQGFDESQAGDFLKTYFQCFTDRIHGHYLGTIVRGGSAGVCFMPAFMNRKLFAQLRSLGNHLEIHACFPSDIRKDFESPYRLSSRKVLWYRFLGKIGFMDMSWNRMLKQNHAYAKRFDRPYKY